MSIFFCGSFLFGSLSGDRRDGTAAKSPSKMCMSEASASREKKRGDDGMWMVVCSRVWDETEKLGRGRGGT